MISHNHQRTGVSKAAAAQMKSWLPPSPEELLGPKMGLPLTIFHWVIIMFPLELQFSGYTMVRKKNISRLIVHHSLLEEWTIVLRPWSWFHRKNVASWFSMSQKVKTSLYVVPHWAKSLSWCVHNSNFTNWFMLDILTYLLGVINQRSHNWGTTLWTWSKVS